MKYVLVSGGVISGIGKGIIASSTGLLLKTLGLKVTAIKIDPYMNVDAGTMAPTEHGEVFVLDDGGEVDLDLGNYERYLNVTLTRENNITTGKIYQHVIDRERRGDYLGRTVQVVPHLTDATQDWIERVARIPVDDTKEPPDVCVIELGGTVGDIESGPFVETMRQLRRRAGRDNFLHIHVSLVPVDGGGEQKTKPTQRSTADARSKGLSPDLIACRCSEPLKSSTIDKIAMFCEVEPNQVIGVHDVSTTYRVPLLLHQQGLVERLRSLLQLDALTISPDLVTRGAAIWNAWKSLTSSQTHTFETVTIVLVGKYTNLHDSYLSVIKSLEHAAMACSRKLNLLWVDASHLEDETSRTDPAAFHKAWHEVCTAQGILVPGGFGHRGTEGMIAAARWARTHRTPYLGICLGMQIAVIEYARSLCDMPQAGSEELNEQTPDPIVVYMPEIDRGKLGGTMRLGLRPTLFQPGSEWSRLRALYSATGGLIRPQSPDQSSMTPSSHVNGVRHSVELPTSPHHQTSSLPSKAISSDSPAVLERHRHRYEVNPKYIERLAAAGLEFIGKDDRGERMEILELRDHPWFVGVQFHPEYLSRVLEPSKPYLGFVAASAGCLPAIMDRVCAGRAVNGDTQHGLVAGLQGVVM